LGTNLHDRGDGQRARADMIAPLPTSNPLLAELHERFAGEYLQHFDHAQTSYRAREVIIRRLPDGEPRVQRRGLLLPFLQEPELS
jgi:hypothetical protein